MTVRELIEVLERFPDDFVVCVGSGEVVAVWLSETRECIDIDYGNTWYLEDGRDPDFQLHFNARPDEKVYG